MMPRLLRAQARRDRWQLTFWILGIGVLAVGSAAAVVQEFGDAAERAALLMLATGNPALLAIRGVPDGISTGSVIFFEIFTFLAVLAALMSTFLTVRHSRGDEEQGRSELVGATPVNRSAALAATLTLGLLANLAVAVLVAAGFAATGLPIAGSILTGLATGGTGLAFCGVAAVAAQVCRTSRAANSLAGALVALAFLLRAFGDATGTVSDGGLRVTSEWPSWFSPIGWGQQVHAFGHESAAPLLLDAALFAVTGAAALYAVRARDLGAGLLGDRPGRATARPSLLGTLGLAWRLQFSAVVGWGAAGALIGLFAGGLADAAVTAVQENKALAATVRGLVAGGTSGLLDTFVAAIMSFLGVLAAGAALQAVLHVRIEEAGGRSELLLSGPVSKSRLLVDSLTVAVVSVVLVLLAGGLVTGLAFVATGHADRFGDSLLAAFVQLPAALVFAAVAALVFAVAPRLTIGLGWGLLALGFVLGQFGGVFKLPDWLRNVSPFTHTPVVQGDNVDWTPLAVMLAVSLAVGAASVLLSRRRDVVT